MIDNHHLAYVGVLTVFVIGATVVSLVWTLVLATAFAVAGFVRIRKRRKPIAAINANEDGPDEFSAPAASHPRPTTPPATWKHRFRPVPGAGSGQCRCFRP